MRERLDWSNSQTLISTVFLVALLAAGCGGGGGGNGGGDNSGGGTAPVPGPVPPVVGYDGPTTPAQLDEGNAAHFTANLIDGLVLVESFFSEMILRELDLVTGRISRTVAGSQGGRAVVSGNIARDRTGWIQVEYENFAEGGITLNGREVQTILAPRTSTAGSVRLSYYGLRFQSGNDRFEFTGSLTRQESGLDPISSTISVDMLITDLGMGEWRRLGPWQYQVRFHPGEGVFRIPAASFPVYSPEFGVANASVQQPLEFGQDFADYGPGDPGPIEISPGPHRGELLFGGANGSRFRLAGLNRFFGALVFEGNDGRLSTRRIAWEDQYDLIVPGAGVVVASAGPAYRGEVFERVTLEGRMAEHTGSQRIQHEWRLVALPPGSESTLQDSQSPTPWFVPDRFGTYLIEQKVTDGILENTDYARVIVLDWQADIPIDTAIPGVTPYGGADRRVALGASLTLDGRTSGAGVPLQKRFISWSMPDTLGGELIDAPVTSVIAMQRGGYSASVDVVVPGLNTESAAVNVFVDTPFWSHRPLLLADEAGVLVRPTDVALADYSGNGTADLIVSRWIPALDRDDDGLEQQQGALLTVYPVGSGGRLGDPRNFTTPFAGAMAVADLDGDGRKDIVLRGDRQVAVFFQQADGHLQAGPMFGLGPCRNLPHDRGGLVHIGDVTGNGRPDIVAAGACEQDNLPVSTLITLVQEEPGTFSAVHTPIGDGWLSSLVAGDLNGNGRMDIAMGAGFIGGGGLQVGFARADGGFDFEYFLLGSSVSGPVVSDLNGNGRNDVAIIADGALELFLQRPGGGFDRRTDATGQVGSDDRPFGLGDWLFAGDLNGDGHTDLLLVGWSGGGLSRYETHVMMQDSQSRFERPVHMPLLSSEPRDGTRILVADLDGDGKGEIIAGRSNGRFGIHTGTLEISIQRP